MKRLLVALSAVAVLATACGGGSSPIAAPGLAAAVSGDAAVSTTSVLLQGNNASGAPLAIGGNGDVPAGFPMPVPDWAEVVVVTQDESRGAPSYSVQLLVDSTRKDEMLDIYRTFYADQGMTIDDAGDFISGQNADVFTAVTAAASGDSTIIILAWGPN